MLPWLLCLSLAFLLLLLLIKLHLLRQGMEEISGQVGQRLTEDSNNPIFLPSRDKALMGLAAALNLQLRQLRQARQRYEGGDRELKEAVTNISHDLRTPLTALCGHLDLLEAEELSEAAQRHVAAIRNRAEALKRLTEELLHYSSPPKRIWSWSRCPSTGPWRRVWPAFTPPSPRRASTPRSSSPPSRWCAH